MACCPPSETLAPLALSLSGHLLDRWEIESHVPYIPKKHMLSACVCPRVGGPLYKKLGERCKVWGGDPDLPRPAPVHSHRHHHQQVIHGTVCLLLYLWLPSEQSAPQWEWSKAPGRHIIKHEHSKLPTGLLFL